MEKQTLVIEGDRLIVALADGAGGDCSQLKIWESKDQMANGDSPAVEINFSSIYKMEVFWVLNVILFGKIFKKLTGRGISQSAPGKTGH